MVPSYGNKSNQNDSLTAKWKALEEGDVYQYEALFEELERWNVCLEKPSGDGKVIGSEKSLTQI